MSDPKRDVKWVPEHIEALSPYQPGKPIEELERELGITGAIKLASNENPLGPSPLGIAAAQRSLAESNRYPDGAGHRLRVALAARFGVSTEEVGLGGGSNELIVLLVRNFCRPGVDEVVTHRYAFFMYKVSCGAHGVKLVESAVGDDLACDVDALADAVTDRTRVVLLPNPNNPTGSYVPRAAFERLLARLPAHVVLVCDEAYFEYAETLADYPVAEKYRGKTACKIVTLRTFSKAYGLAALRVGYAIADKDVIGYLNRVRMPFNVSTPAQEAALAALGDTAHVARSRQVNADGLVQLMNGLAQLDVRAFPSAGNFVLVDLRREAGPVYQALLKKGVIVRPLAPSGLLRHVRISVSTAEENARALAALAEVLKA
jgi:histidinol-phosphate aminotransferase